MKKLIALLLSLLCMAGCAQNQESTSAVYTGEGQGFGGTVAVTLTMEDGKITEVEIVGDDETASVGQAAFDQLKENILAAQSSDFDAVSGATMTSNGVKAAVKAALDQANGTTSEEKTALTDGTYNVSAAGYSWTGMINADVTIADNKITAIDIKEEHESETGEMAQTAFDNMIPRIIENQSLATDAITGATATSNAIKDLVAQAIEQAGGDASQWQDPVAKSEEVVKIEGYDVIVVGLGGSGITAYCAAADTGASVFGIEAAAKLGGQTATTTGPMVIDAENEAFAGVEFANADDVYDTWIEYVGSEEKADIIHEAVYNSGKYLDYYMDNFGFEFEGMITSFANPEWSQLWTRYVGEDGTSNIFGPTKTYQFDRAMEIAVAKNEKNDYQLELRGEELIMEDGVVKGVKAVAYDGTTYEIYGDAVILATGGFIGDDEMVLESFGTTLNTVASLVNDGTGIKMGLSAGGTTYMQDVDPMIHILQIPNMIKNDDLTADQKAILSALALVEGETEVTVDGEALDPALVEAMIPGYKYYVVYTQEDIDNYKNSGFTENFATATSHFMSQGGSFEVGQPISDLDEILAVGMEYNDVLKADSISDLAAQIGCDENVLSETLGGNDTTYYAVICSGYTYGTVGGLDVDVNMNVLREDGTPIENLYAVGTDSMGVENVEGKPYTPWGGQANSWVFVSGYLGGHAAGEYGLAK